MYVYIYIRGQVFHGAKGVSMIHRAVNGAITSGATGSCWKSCMIYIAHTHARTQIHGGTQPVVSRPQAASRL